MELPCWMLDGREPWGKPRPQRSRRYILKSLKELNSSLYRVLMNETYQTKRGLWQALDPRVKLISTLLVLMGVGVTRSLSVLLVLAIAAGIIMWFSRLPVLSLKAKIWFFVPLLTLLVSLPGTLNVFNAGTPWLVLLPPPASGGWLTQVFPQGLAVTKQGVKAALFLTLRTGVSLSWGALLFLTTPASGLIKSLKAVGTPSFLVVILEMSYRYLSVLIKVAKDMLEARELRTVGEISYRRQRGLVGSSIAHLFGTSYSLYQEVYEAMCCRGYNGEVVSFSDMEMSVVDMVWIGALLFLGAGCIWLEGFRFG